MQREVHQCNGNVEVWHSKCSSEIIVSAKFSSSTPSLLLRGPASYVTCRPIALFSLCMVRIVLLFCVVDGGKEKKKFKLKMKFKLKEKEIIMIYIIPKTLRKIVYYKKNILNFPNPVML